MSAKYSGIDSLDWLFPFGKHKGRSLRYVAEYDIDYIYWAKSEKLLSISCAEHPKEVREYITNFHNEKVMSEMKRLGRWPTT